MPEGGPSVWIAALIGALATGVGRVVGFIPALLGAIVILLIGWGIGKLIQWLVTSGLRAVHFDVLTQRAGVNAAFERANIKFNASKVLGVVAYWFVFLIAIHGAVSILGLPTLSALATAVILYIPKIFAAILVLIVGAWLGSWLGRMTNDVAAASNISYASILGSIVQGFVLFFAFAMALDLLGLTFPFMTTAFAIILGTLGLAAAVAFGLGGREYASDVLAGRELRSMFRVGDRLATEKIDGTITAMNPTVTVISTSRGNVAVQNSDLMHQHVTKPTGPEGGSMGKAA